MPGRNGMVLKKKTTSLADVYLKPLNESISFVKSVSSGTGLGKSWSAIFAALEFVKSKTEKGDETPHIFFYTAPQHNQISFDDKIVKRLQDAGCDVVKVRPISAMALSNIEQEMNSYDIAKDLIKTPTDKLNSLYNDLIKICTSIDRAIDRSDSTNPIELALKLKTIRYQIGRIEQEQGKGSISQADEDSLKSNVSDDIDEDLTFIKEQENEEEANRSKDRIVKAMEKITSSLVLLTKHSYTNEPFRKSLKENLSDQSYKKFREVSSSFHPFLHVQTSDSRFFILAMTIKKFMTKHTVLAPRIMKTKNIIRWGNRPVDIREIVSDRSTINIKVAEIFDNASDTNTVISHTDDNLSKIFRANYTFFIDESDASKEVISKELSRNVEDAELIQAIGAFSKEVGDVLLNESYTFLSQLVERQPECSLVDIFRDIYNDDSVPRMLSKEALMKARSKIYQSLINCEWKHLNGESDPSEIMAKINSFLKNALTAPYCTVEQSVDAQVFNTTAAFGGEMYGFTGSKNIDNFIVVSMGNSFRITEADRAKDIPFPSLPLSYFMLLISECYLYFRLILKGIGGESSDINQSLSFNECIAENDKAKLQKLMNKYYGESAPFSGVGAPFRQDGNSDLPLHTDAAKASIRVTHRITNDLFSEAFSDGKEIAALVNDDVKSFSSAVSTPIDMDFSYKKGHTIYGMVQIENSNYPIKNGLHHVAFPTSFRSQSAEKYLVDLVDNEKRINGIFVMSATGGFENNHISAFSLVALRKLLEGTNAVFVEMSKEDYLLTNTKQNERAEFKNINSQFLIESDEPSFRKSLMSEIGYLIKKIRSNSIDSISSSIAQLAAMNKHKLKELDNVMIAINKALENDSQSPTFALALAQTHKNVLRALTYAAQIHSVNVNGSPYFITPYLNQRPSIDNTEQATGYGVFLITNHANYANRWGVSSPFNKKGGTSNTIVVCYSAPFEKALKKILKTAIYNPHSDEYKLKKLLLPNSRPQDPVKEAASPNFNPMDYLLSSAHGNNVIIVSAYVSAARGINLIVDKTEPPKAKITSKDDPQGHMFTHRNEQQTSSKKLKLEPKDLDDLYICAPPFYSEVNQPIVEDSLNRVQAQKRYFTECDLYYYYIEYLARKGHDNPEELFMSDQVDLDTRNTDQEAFEYFDEQHHLSIFSTLQQGIGRIERTNASQSQNIYLCPEAYDVLKDGIAAVISNLNDEEIDCVVGSMSYANGTLADSIIDQIDYDSEDSSESSGQVSKKSPEHRTFDTGKSIMLQAHQDLRNPNESTYKPETVSKLIDFYEVFRSEIPWTEGAESYLVALKEALLKLPEPIQDQMEKFILTLFVKSPVEIHDFEPNNLNQKNSKERLIGLLEHAAEFEQSLSIKSQNLKNPYVTRVPDGFMYPCPWFIPDLVGNYGEYVLKSVVEILSRNPDNKHLNRKNSDQARACYEWADNFIVQGNKVLALDAKHYASIGYHMIRTPEDAKRNEVLLYKLASHLKAIKSVFEGYDVHLIAINTVDRSDSNVGLKATTQSKNLFLLSALDKPQTIAAYLADHFAGM